MNIKKKRLSHLSINNMDQKRKHKRTSGNVPEEKP